MKDDEKEKAIRELLAVLKTPTKKFRSSIEELTKFITTPETTQSPPQTQADDDNE